MPLAEGYVHDLDAMLAEVTAATQLVCVCNPNNPTGDPPSRQRIAEFCERVPDHVTVALDEAYIEFQTNDDPDATVDLLAEFPNLVVVRTFSKVTGWPACAAATRCARPSFRGAVDAVRQPFSVNELAQAAAAEAILHADDVAERVERTIVERVFVEEGLRELGFEPAGSQANFSWVRSASATRRAVIRRPRRAGRRGPRRRGPRRPGPHPRHLRHAGRERALSRSARGGWPEARNRAQSPPGAWYKPSMDRASMLAYCG